MVRALTAFQCSLFLSTSQEQKRKPSISLNSKIRQFNTPLAKLQMGNQGMIYLNSFHCILGEKTLFFPAYNTPWVTLLCLP